MGMSLTTTPDDVLRSVYEGVALSLADCGDHLGMTGDLVVSSGGLALTVAGRYDTVEDAAAAMTCSFECFDPHPERGRIYRAVAEVYFESRVAIRPVWPSMREIRNMKEADSVN